MLREILVEILGFFLLKLTATAINLYMHGNSAVFPQKQNVSLDLLSPKLFCI